MIQSNKSNGTAHVVSFHCKKGRNKMGIQTYAQTIIELNINDAEDKIPGFKEFHQLLNNYWVKAKHFNSTSKDRDIYYGVVEDMEAIVDSYYTGFPNDIYDTDHPHPKLGYRILELYQNIVEDMYQKYGNVLEYMSFSPYYDANLDAQYFAYGFKVDDMNNLLNNPENYNKLNNDLKCSVQTYTNVL